MLKRHVGIVVPARNEERHLTGVLDTVCAVRWLNQIVVIDDNSSDSTLEIAENYACQDERLSVIHQKISQGKSRGLLAGVSALHERIGGVQKRSVMYAQVITTWLKYRKDEQWLEPKVLAPRGELEDTLI